MPIRKSHLKTLTRQPASAQTVQQLKFDTLLIYLENFFLVIEGGLTGGAQVNNFIADLVSVLPYKGFGGSNGGTTS